MGFWSWLDTQNSYMFLGIHSIYTPVYLPRWGFGQNQPSWPALARFTRSLGPYWEATHHPCMSVDFLKYTPRCPRGIFSQIHPLVDIQECISNNIYILYGGVSQKNCNWKALVQVPVHSPKRERGFWTLNSYRPPPYSRLCHYIASCAIHPITFRGSGW